MVKIRWLRWTLVMTIICFAILVAGYRLIRPEPDTAAAAPIPPASRLVKDASIIAQATTIEEVEARGVQPADEQIVVFENEQFNYRVSYPGAWDMTELSSNVTLFHSPDGATRVKIEAAGPLPGDGLSPFVDRSLSNDVIISRQLLTIHGLPAERVIAYSRNIDSQVTTFYIEARDAVYLITGVGEQRPIEMIARSFNAAQAAAQ